MGTSYKHAMVEDRIYGTPEDIPLTKKYASGKSLK